MKRTLEELLEAARNVFPTPQQVEEHRRSFAFGNASLENPSITRELVDFVADRNALLKHKGETYAELLSEDEPNGPVIIRQSNGAPVLLMPREVWDELRAEKIPDSPK